MVGTRRFLTRSGTRFETGVGARPDPGSQPDRSPRGSLPRVGLPLVAAVAVALPGALPVPSGAAPGDAGPVVAGTAVPLGAVAGPPAAPDFPREIEPLPAWEPETGCRTADSPGTTAFARLLADTYGPTTGVLTRRACAARSSGHHEGRALDWMLSARRREDRATAQAFLDWLLREDRYGNRYAHARRLGVMYLIWDNRMFRLYRPQDGWTEYNGCLDEGNAEPAKDTTCHRDHIHISLTWAGADRRTSWWTRALPPSCAVAAAPAEQALTPRGEVRRVTTTVFRNDRDARGRAIGTPGGLPCEVPVDGRVGVAVAGGSVPVGVAQAVLEVRADALAGDSWVRIPGGRLVRRDRRSQASPRLAVGAGRSATAVWTVSLGPSGRVQLLTGPSRVDLRVRVLGYRTADAGSVPDWMRGVGSGAAEAG